MRLISFLAAAALVLGSVLPAAADSLRWTIRSDYPHIVSLEFYSQDYNRA